MSENADLLKIAVVNGLQALMALHLDGAPGFETVGMTAEVWIEIVRGWNLKNTAADSQRLAVGFKQLAGSVVRWPAPSQLKLHLPAPQPAAVNGLLPALSPEQAQRNRAMIKALLMTLGDCLDGTKSPEQIDRAKRKLKKQGEAINKKIAKAQGE